MSNKERKIDSKRNYYAFSAPSGAGKTTIIKELLKRYGNLAISVSATTRSKRKGETDGIDYFFITKEQFERYIDEDRFIEYEKVHHDFYGTLKETVQQLIDNGKTVLFDIDVNGALRIKEKYPETVLIFIKPPSIEILIERLKNRKSETEATLKKRLQRIDYEYSKAELFDYIVVNDNLQTAIEEVEKIIEGMENNG
jgi:guanylate kinase